jgi:23S rRNA (uridine2552-2'-O)-methyltransferase
MPRSKSSKMWLREHVTDPYVRRAQVDGYRSRAAYKLLALDAKDRLLAPGQVVVDLGSAPGSWSQVAAAKVGAQGRIVALDLLEMAPLRGVTFISGDFSAAETAEALAHALSERPADLVLSDLAPNISGVAASDQSRMIHLNELAADFALEWLRPGGALVMKTFQGAGFPELLARVRSSFSSVMSRKPDASRDRSAEVYLLARGPRRRW